MVNNNTQRLLIKEEKIVELKQEVEEHKNKYKEYTTKLGKYIEMSKQGIEVKETDKKKQLFKMQMVRNLDILTGNTI